MPKATFYLLKWDYDSKAKVLTTILITPRRGPALLPGYNLSALLPRPVSLSEPRVYK